jgi:hypothetical protein
MLLLSTSRVSVDATTETHNEAGAEDDHLTECSKARHVERSETGVLAEALEDEGHMCYTGGNAQATQAHVNMTTVAFCSVLRSRDTLIKGSRTSSTGRTNDTLM